MQAAFSGRRLAYYILNGRQYHYWNINHSTFQLIHEGVTRDDLVNSRGGAVWDYLRRAGCYFRKMPGGWY